MTRYATRSEAGLPAIPLSRYSNVGRQDDATAHWTATDITARASMDLDNGDDRPEKPGIKWYKLWRNPLTEKYRRVQISRRIRAYNKAMAKWKADREPSAAELARLDAIAYRTVRTFWNWHVKNRGWTDIGYHRVVFAHGLVVEARPAGFRGAHSGHNIGNRTLGVAFVMGPGDIGSPEMVQAANDLELRDEVTIRYGHSDWIPTSCPGPWVGSFIVNPGKAKGYRRGTRPPLPRA